MNDLPDSSQPLHDCHAYGVSRLIEAEESINVSPGSDGTIGVLIRRGGNQTAIVLSAEEARHVAGLMLDAAQTPGPVAPKAK